MKKLRSPVKWFGGKGWGKKTILPLLPRCQTYVEPFGGGANILLNRAPSPVEVYNDLHDGLHALFAVLADEALFEKFYRRVAVMPYSRKLFIECRDGCRTEEDPVKKAAMFFVVARQCFSGDAAAKKPSWSMSVSTSSRGMAQSASAWLSMIDMLPDIHARLRRVQIEHVDALSMFDRYDTPETLFYCDPPYMTSTRTGDRYEHECTDDFHRQLLDKLCNVKGMVALSGYGNEMYDSALSDWDRTEFSASCFSVGKTKASGLQGTGELKEVGKRTEVLWRNKACMGGCVWRDCGSASTHAHAAGEPKKEEGGSS